MWDLTTRDNWQLLLSEGRTVTYTQNTTPDRIPYRYTPIQSFYTTPTTHTLLIGAVSSTAKSHWFLGAIASQYLYLSPSITPGLTSGVQAGDSKKIGLNRLTLIEFNNYDVSPYVLKLDIPYWLEDIHIEVWEYQGYLPTDTDNSEILDRLDEIEDKLDALENYGT